MTGNETTDMSFVCLPQRQKQVGGISKPGYEGSLPERCCSDHREDLPAKSRPGNRDLSDCYNINKGRGREYKPRPEQKGDRS